MGSNRMLEKLFNEKPCVLYILLYNFSVIMFREDQKGGVCGTYGRKEKYMEVFFRKTSKERDWL